MRTITPLFASDRSAAKLFDITRPEFIRLVENGHLPPPQIIGGIKRWDVEELQRIARGDRIEEIGGISW